MAVYSMTGFASASAPAGEASRTGGGTGAAVTAELRSVNGRFLDIGFRMPDELRAQEPALRDLLSAAFRRGKLELRLSSAQTSSDAWPAPNAEQMNRLLHLQGSVQSWLPDARPLSVNEVMQWCRGGGATERLDEAALEATRRCIEGLREAREREGAKLAAMIEERLRRLGELAAQARPLLPQVVQRQQQRFVERWNEALASVQAGGQVAPQTVQERALGEAAAFAIRIDVAEELSRLESHLVEIGRLLRAGGEVGKRLDFLIQELQREANTLGSKSAALELTNLSVEMKVAIEQMREQVQNLE